VAGNHSGLDMKRLTKRELDMIAAIANGEQAKEIANKYKIGLRTVQKHISNLYKKMKAKNAPHCVSIGYEHKILPYNGNG
jgi:DNA-binding NarL/FixJ family response regulator